MATDKHLPSVLAQAAGRVDRVAEQLTSTAGAVQSVAAMSMLGWAGPFSGKWSAGCLRLSRDLIAEAGQARALASTLRRAQKNAEGRIMNEFYAAEKARIAAEKAHAAQARGGR